MSCFDIVELPVTIVKPLEDQEVTEQDDVTFLCEINKDNQEASWMCGNVKITDGVDRF